MPGKNCSIANCKSNSQRVKENGEHVMFFSFPKDGEICKEWIRRCCRKNMSTVQYKRVCSKHFSLDDYEDQLKAFLMGTYPKTLKKTAVPTLLLPKIQELPHILKKEIHPETKKQRQQNIVDELSNKTNWTRNVVPDAENENQHFQGSISRNGSMFEITDVDLEEEQKPQEKKILRCVVPHCRSTGDDNVFFYHFPKNEELKKIWIEILKLKDTIEESTKVCSLHFSADDFSSIKGEPSFEHRPQLNESAVPSINLCENQVLNGVVFNTSTTAEMYEINETDEINSVAQKSTSTINGHLAHGNITNNNNNEIMPENLTSSPSDDDLNFLDHSASNLPSIANVITKDNFKEMCRCCVINKGDVNVFEAHFQNLPISDLISFCTTEEISPNDDLPRSICEICMQLIVSSYTFIKTVKDSQIHIKELQQLFKKQSTINNLETLTPDEGISIQKSDSISIEEPQTNAFKREYRKLNNIYMDLCDVLEENRRVINEPEEVEDIKFDRNFLNIWRSRKDSKGGNPKDFLSQIMKKSPTEISEEMTVNDSPTTVEVHSLPSDITKTNLKKIIYSDFDDVKIKCDNGSPQVTTDRKISEITCFECSDYFATERKLVEHSIQTGHVIPARFKCKQCSATFQLRRKYKVHLSTHKRQIKTSVCEICGLTLAPRNLSRHLKSHTTKSKQICQICGKEFNQKASLDLHIKYKHSGINDCLCFICGRTFSNLALMNKHLNDEHDDEELANKSYSCKKCRKYFACETSLKLHRKCEPTWNTTRQCLLCLKDFPNAVDLMKHRREAHEEKLPHRFSSRPKTFPRGAHLKKHLLKHNGGMPYKCTYCSRTFRFKKYYDNHIRSHTEIRNFNCLLCDKTFSHILLLQRHQQSHS